MPQKQRFWAQKPNQDKFIDLLKQCIGNKSAAASRMGVTDRRYLYEEFGKDEAFHSAVEAVVEGFKDTYKDRVWGMQNSIRIKALLDIALDELEEETHRTGKVDLKKLQNIRYNSDDHLVKRAQMMANEEKRAAYERGEIPAGEGNNVSINITPVETAGTELKVKA